MFDFCSMVFSWLFDILFCHSNSSSGFSSVFGREFNFLYFVARCSSAVLLHGFSWV